MKALFFLFCLGVASISFGQISSSFPQVIPVMGSPLVNFDQFETLADSVGLYRENRLITTEKFIAFSQEKNTVILDTRSKAFFDKKHVKGAINLPFADFTQGTLEALIPDKNTRIVIYCNNNFVQGLNVPESRMVVDPNFASKVSRPLPYIKSTKKIRAHSNESADYLTILNDENPIADKSYTLALNIPTFINLYGYGYQNVYELKDLIATNSGQLTFEGTDVDPKQVTLNFTPITPLSPFVKFSDLQELIPLVKPHREQRLISLNEFNQMKQDGNTIILDARSKEMYDAKHVKGAIHLEFSEFTQSTLDQLTKGDRNKRILIYCNNNFITDIEKMQQDRYFMSKVALDPPKFMSELTLALNIPTYINLYGYGYQNVYELNELVVTSDPRIEFEGNAVE